MQFFRRYLSALLFAAALACGAAWQSAPASAQVTPQNVVIEGSTHTDAATIRVLFHRHRSGERQPRRRRPFGDRHVQQGQRQDRRRPGASSPSSRAARSSTASPSRATTRSRATSLRSKSRRRATPVSTTPRPTPTSSASKTPTRRSAAPKSRSATGWCNCPTAASTSCSRSTRATRPACAKSSSSATSAVSNYRLRSLMQTTEMNFLSWFKTSDVYDPDRLAQDEEAIRKYYMKYGYADFRIANTDVAYHAATGRRLRHHDHGRRRRAVPRLRRDGDVAPGEGGQRLARAVRQAARRRRLQRDRGRQDGRCHHPRAGAAGLRLLRRAAARPARRGDPPDRRSPSPSTTARRSISSASTSSATPAPATT